MVKKLISWIRGLFGPRKKKVRGLNVRLLKKLRRRFLREYGIVTSSYDPDIHDYRYHITYMNVELIREYELTRKDAMWLISDQVRKDIRKWLDCHGHSIRKVKYLW